MLGRDTIFYDLNDVTADEISDTFIVMLLRYYHVIIMLFIIMLLSCYYHVTITLLSRYYHVIITLLLTASFEVPEVLSLLLSTMSSLPGICATYAICTNREK